MKLLNCVRMLHSGFKGNSFQDCHELLCYLRDDLDKEVMTVRSGHMQQGSPSDVVPTVIHSIFGGQLSYTTSCKCCSFKSVSHAVFHDLSVPLRPKGTPAKSVASPEHNERCMSQQKNHTKPFLAVGKATTEKINTISEGDYPQFRASESEDIVMVKTSFDSNTLEQIWQSKDDVHCPLQTPIREEIVLIASGRDVERNNSAVLDNAIRDSIRPEDSTEAKMGILSAKVTIEDKGKTRSHDIVYGEAEDINSVASIEACLELHFKADMIEQRCENCSMVSQKESTISGKDGELMVACTNVNRTVDGDEAEQSEGKTCQSEQSSSLIKLDVECSSSSRQSVVSDAQHQVMPAVHMKTKGDISGMSCGEKDLSSCSIVNEKTECLEEALEDVPTHCLAEKQVNLLDSVKMPP